MIPENMNHRGMEQKAIKRLGETGLANMVSGRKSYILYSECFRIKGSID